MSRLVFAMGTLVLLALPSGVTAAPRTVFFARAGDTKPALVAGTLSEASRKPAADIARNFLRRTPDLAPCDPSLLGNPRVFRLRNGTVVRFPLEHLGIPVADASVAVRFDAEGRVRMVVGTPVGALPVNTQPLLSEEDARTTLTLRHAPLRSAAIAQAKARLVWQPLADRSLRLAWEIRLPLNPLVPEALIFRVDAMTGDLLRTRNLVRFENQAKVYPTNPVTSSLTTVTLEPTSPDPSAPDALANADVTVLNCKDLHHTVPLNLGPQTINVHLCDEIPTVTRDANGDYLYDPPSPDAWGSDPQTAPADEDSFSEVQMYYHIMKVYGYFRSFGNPEFRDLDAKPVQATVNFRIPIDTSSGSIDYTNLMNPNGTLYPFTNAFFMPPGELIPGLFRPASMVFGQGGSADFAYDGDVIYHEFTHAVIWSTSNLMGPGLDEYGLDPAPMGLNEGFADTFSSLVAGDPQVGEYAAGVMGGIRDLTVKYRCPDLLWGEAHQDSMAFSWAMWAIAQELGPDAEAPLFAALVQLPEDASFGLTSSLIEEEIEAALGTQARESVHAILLEANLIDCKRVIPYTGPREFLVTEGTSIGLNPVPGYVQFLYSLPAPAKKLTVTFDWLDNSMGFGAGSPAYTVYVRKDAPIQWSYGVTGATATKDQEFVLSATGQQNSWSGSLETILEPGDYYLQIVSTGEVGGYLLNIAITHEGAPQEDAGVPPGQDAGVPPGQDAGNQNIDGRDSGCGCATTAPSGGLAALLAIALLLVWRRRRS